MISSSLMGKETLKVGSHPQLIQIQELVNMEHAALRWIFGKQTRSLLPILHILALLKATTDVKARSAGILTNNRDSMESVTKMVVT